MRQQQVNIDPPIGVEGGLASTNPIRSVFAPAGAFVANAAGARVGYFNWIQADGTVAPFAPNLASGPTVPDGILLNEGQGIITDYLGKTSMLVAAGLGVTLVDRADLFVRSWYQTATRGMKAFANIFTGQIAFGAPGAFVDINIPAASVTGSVAAGTNILTVTSVGSGTVAVGQSVLDASGALVGVIAAQGTGSGSTGTYFLNQPSATHFASQTFHMQAGASLGASVNADISGTAMTVNSVTFGALAVGMFVTGTGIPAGTYIVSGSGTSWVLSASATETGITVTASPWIETPWFAESNGNAGDLVVIGIKN